MTKTVTVLLDDLMADQVDAIAQILKTSPEGVLEFALKMTIEELKDLYPEVQGISPAPHGRC